MESQSAIKEMTGTMTFTFLDAKKVQVHSALTLVKLNTFSPTEILKQKACYNFTNFT